MPAGGSEQRIPEDLGIVMGVDIDKPGSDGETISLDDLPCIATDFPDGDDAASADRDIAGIALRARPVIDPAVFDQQIVTHKVLLSHLFAVGIVAHWLTYVLNGTGFHRIEDLCTRRPVARMPLKMVDKDGRV
jgi:hypothetical protein